MNKLEIMEELRTRLAGKCGGACPVRIFKSSHCIDLSSPYPWDCQDCIVEFGFIRGCEDKRCYSECPCKRGSNPEEVFLRLDEVIEELKEEGKE